MMRRFYALTLLLFATISIYGFDFVVDGIKYQTSDNNVVYVEGLENPNYSGELIIPEKVTYKDKEYVVKGIDSEAFMGCEGLTSLVLGNSIEDIYYWAFKDCTNLASFSIPNSVEYIDEEVFVNTAWYNALPDGLIYKDNVLLGFKGSKEGFEGHLDIADGTRIIAGGALKYTMSISSVKIPNTVTSICQGAFFQSGITSLIIPNSVKGIYHQAFHWCNKLEKIEVESGNPVYDSRNNCNAIIETGKNQLAFGCKNTVIPNSVTSIKEFAFRGHWMKSIVIPKSIISIGSWAFMDCWRLETICSEIEEPFKISNDVFEDYDEKTLYVPVGTKAKYEATEGWKDFKNIVEMAMLDPITGETTVNTEGLGNENLSDNVVNDVYYNVGSEGYDASDKSVVISQTTNMGQITDATPGSSEVKNNFNGLILKVAAGKGTITVNVKTTGNAQLVVQVGNQTPMIASKTEQGDVVVSYDVAEDTYVYIYAIIGSSAAPAHRAAPADAVKIYSIKVTPGATGIDTVHSAQSTVHSCYTLDGRKLEGLPTKKGVYIVNGKKIVVK